MTGIEHTRDTKEYHIYKKYNCKVHKFGDKFVDFSMNTLRYKTHSSAFNALGGVTSEGEVMELGNRMVTSGGKRAGENLKEEAIGTYCDNLLPKPSLINQYKLDRDTV